MQSYGATKKPVLWDTMLVKLSIKESHMMTWHVEHCPRLSNGRMSQYLQLLVNSLADKCSEENGCKKKVRKGRLSATFRKQSYGEMKYLNLLKFFARNN